MGGGGGGQRLRRGGGGPGRASAAVAGGSSGRGLARRKPCRCSSSTVSLRGRDTDRQHRRDHPPDTAAPLLGPARPGPARRYLCGRGPQARAQHRHAMLGASPRAERFRGSRPPSCGRGGGAGGSRSGEILSAAGPLRSVGARGAHGALPGLLPATGSGPPTSRAGRHVERVVPALRRHGGSGAAGSRRPP